MRAVTQPLLYIFMARCLNTHCENFIFLPFLHIITPPNTDKARSHIANQGDVLAVTVIPIVHSIITSTETGFDSSALSS